jgi:YVTN family beta-propeller protein
LKLLFLPFPPALLLLSAALVSVAGVHAQGGRLLVAQKGDRSLAIIDPAAGTALANVAENGVTGHEVAGSTDGRRAYVPIYGDSGVGKPGTDGSNMIVVDVATHKIVGNVDWGHGVRPHCVVLGPKDGMVYVTTELDHSISVVDPKTLKIVGVIPTGQAESHMLAISHNGRRGYTANVGPGTVSVLDMAGRKTLAVIQVSKTIQRISITPDDKWVFTADQTKPEMAVIDTATNKVTARVPLSGYGYGSTVTKDGRFVLIAVPGKDVVDVVDLKTMKLVHSVAVGKDPQETLVRPDGKIAYVSCAGSDQVAEIDLATWKVTRMIATGKSTDGLGWAGM